MYINYNELIKLVSDLNGIRNNVEELFNYIDKSIYLDKIINNIEILIDNDTYNIFFLGNYIDSISSDINYNINDNRTKKFMLKYILYKNSNLIIDILYSLININTYLLESDNNANISVKRKVFSISKKFDKIDNNICKTNGKMYYYIYNNGELIGMFSYIGNYYTDRDKTVKYDDNVKINNKEFVLNNMRHYNDSYFKSIVFENINKYKTKIK